MPRDHGRTATRKKAAPREATPASHTPALVDRGWILDAANDDDIAAKREYHRDHMVAFRQRKKQSLAGMKTLHKQLEAQLAERLAVRRAILLSGCPLGLTSTDDEAPTPEQRRTRFQEIYANLVDEAEVQRAENALLREALEHFAKLKLLLHYELGLLHVVNDPEPEPMNSPDELRGFFVYFQPHEPPFYFEPFTKKECDDATCDGYRKVRVLQDAFDRGELGVRQVQCFGWLAQRSLERTYAQDGSDGPMISRVRFIKRVDAPHGEALATMQRLADFAFDCLTSSEKYRQIQRTTFVNHTLQTFESDQVSLRNAPDPTGSTNVRYLHLLSRVDDSYTNEAGNTCKRSTVLMLALDTPRHKLLRETIPRDDIFWITDGTAFISFVQIDDTTFEIDFGNVCLCISDEQAQYFMIELGAQLLRWENLVMPPRLLAFNN